MNNNSEVLSQAVEKYMLNEKPEFTVTECATFMDMAASYIKKLVSKGVLPHKKVDGELRFSRIEIENWMLSKPIPSIKNVAPSQLVAVWGESENVGELCDSKRFAITKSFLSKKVLQSFHDRNLLTAFAFDDNPFRSGVQSFFQIQHKCQYRSRFHCW